MAARSRKQATNLGKRSHPYAGVEQSPVWNAIDQAITDLVENGDIHEMTARQYITGYLTKSLLDALAMPGPRAARRAASAAKRSVRR